MSLFMSVEEVLTVEPVLVAVGDVAPELWFIIISRYVSLGLSLGWELLDMNIEAS